MIPKVIHYCWFGRGEKPTLAQKCIASWRKYCPDYQIIEWNEDNYDISTAPLFVQQAVEAKKWAFATDFIRLHIVYMYGGIYLDTDVELIKSLDSFLKNSAYFGMDSGGVNTGLGFGASKQDTFLLELMKVYEIEGFIKPDGSMDIRPCTRRELSIYEGHGFRKENGEQILDERIHIYPDEYFAPCNFNTGYIKKTKRTASIHWYSLSWLTENEKDQHKQSMKANRWDYIIHFPNRIGIKLLGDKRYSKIKEIFGR